MEDDWGGRGGGETGESQALALSQATRFAMVHKMAEP